MEIRTEVATTPADVQLELRLRAAQLNHDRLTESIAGALDPDIRAALTYVASQRRREIDDLQGQLRSLRDFRALRLRGRQVS